MSNVKEKDLPSKEEAMNYPLPPTHWLQGVGKLELNKEDNKNYITQLHLINGSGVVVCSCKVSPLTSKVYSINDFSIKDRWILCDRSVEYLRRVVRQAIKQENKGE